MSIAMSIEGSLSDYALLDVIAILAKRKETGRLQIDFKSAQGSFYFDKGELAAAQIGNLTGFSAANLALSMEGTRFRFDPFVEVPAAHISEPNERRLLNRLLRIPTASPDTGNDLNNSECSTTVITPAPLETSVPVTVATETKASGPWQRSLGSLINQSQAYVKQQKLSVRAALILLLGILVAVGIAGLRSKANEPASLRMSHEMTAPASAEMIGALPGAHGEATRVPVTVSNTSARSAPKPLLQETKRASHAEVADPSQTNAPNRLKAMPTETAERGTFEDKKAKPPFREIPVVVRIEDGHVVEAYIKNRHAGGEAFEATALRLARQRRYPKDSRGVETVVFRVTSEP